MHFKRKKPANQRAGCKLCKPWKINGIATDTINGESFGNHRRRTAAKKEIDLFLRKK